MTLTAVIPTLRESLPEPFVRDLWPARTAVSVRDVTLGGVSLLRYVDLCGTPSVVTGDAVIPLSGGVPSLTIAASVVLTRIDAIEAASGARTLRLDARLGGVRHRGSQVRLLDRVSHAPLCAWIVLDRDAGRVAVDAPLLPADLTAGDLLAIPCAEAVALHQIHTIAGEE